MLTIGQFSKVSQIPSKTLRYYDEIGLLKPEHVDPVNGYRYYEADQLKLTLKILQLKSYEFSLAEIQEVMSDNDKLPIILKSKREEILAKATSYSLLQHSIEQYIEELTQGGSIMKNIDTTNVTKVMSPKLNLVSVRENINIANFNELFAKAGGLLAQSQQMPIGAPVTLYHSEEFTPENYDVEIGFPIAPDAVGNHVLEAAECAFYEFHGNYSNLGEAYAILTKWVETNGYKINGVPFEQYMTDPEQVAPDDNVVAVYMPIIKK